MDSHYSYSKIWSFYYSTFFSTGISSQPPATSPGASPTLLPLLIPLQLHSLYPPLSTGGCCCLWVQHEHPRPRNSASVGSFHTGFPPSAHFFGPLSMILFSLLLNSLTLMCDTPVTLPWSIFLQSTYHYLALCCCIFFFTFYTHTISHMFSYLCVGC